MLALEYPSSLGAARELRPLEKGFLGEVGSIECVSSTTGVCGREPAPNGLGGLTVPVLAIWVRSWSQLRMKIKGVNQTLYIIMIIHTIWVYFTIYI